MPGAWYLVHHKRECHERGTQHVWAKSFLTAGAPELSKC